MALKVRPGDLVADRSTVVELMSRYVNPAYDRRRFEWLYLDNPGGRGRLWMAVDGATGEIVGTAGASPRRLVVEGRGITGWVLADFCVADTHRSLGPALQLQRACLEDLAADGALLCYDFPSRTMEAVYRRLGVAARPRLLRFARPLRVQERLARRWPHAGIGRSLGWLADRVLARLARPGQEDATVAVAPHAGLCGPEFSALAERTRGAYRVCVERSAGYLNWRYLQNPIERHEVLCARVDGALVGYSVLSGGPGASTVVDLFGVPDLEVFDALLRHAVARLAARGADTVSVAMLESHPAAALMRRLRFRPRGDSPVVLYAPPGSPLSAEVVQPAGWFLTHGDRDS
jgi:hypothetical protein